MKKYFHHLILLAAMILCGLSASAAHISVEWNDPEACYLQTESYATEGTPIDLPAGATSYTYESDSSVYFYIIAADGYKFDSLLLDGQEMSATVYEKAIYFGRYFSSSSDSQIVAKLSKIERNSYIDINIENGADWINPLFRGGYTPRLRNGENHIGFDEELETYLILNCLNGIDSFYSITLNGEPLAKPSQYSKYYQVNPVRNGDRLDIRVFEGEEPVLRDCVVSLVLPDDLEDCVYSVYDRTASRFLEFVDGKLTVINGTVLGINFKTDDYVYTGFQINGEDAMSFYNSGTLRFTVEEDVTVTVEGTAKEFGNIDFTAYITNPEGVILYRGYYLQNPAELADGIPITSDIAIEGFTMTPADTRKFTIPVSEKRAMIFVAPQPGYYIATLQGYEGKELVETNYISSDMTEFYVVASKLDNYREAKLNLIGSSEAAVLRASSQRSMLWGNPSTSYTLSEGENIIKFIPDYDLPFTIVPIAAPDNFSVYLDGAALSPSDDGIYIFDVYYPADGEEQTVESVITVGADGKPLRTSRTVVKTEDELTAQLLYSEVRTPGNAAGQVLLTGTQITIVPSSEECTIKAGSTVVNGYNEDGEYIYGLNEAGEYVTVTSTANVTYTVSSGSAAPVGIRQTEAEAEGTRIVTIDGRILSKEADPTQLEKGIYIVNGKKVVVK